LSRSCNIVEESGTFRNFKLDVDQRGGITRSNSVESPLALEPTSVTHCLDHNVSARACLTVIGLVSALNVANTLNARRNFFYPVSNGDVKGDTKET
jgi:hypothetical protein